MATATQAIQNGKVIPKTTGTTRKSSAKTPQKKVNLDARLERIRAIASLTAKVDKLADTQYRLTEFRNNSDGECSIIIKEGYNDVFSTSNTNLVELLVTHLGDLLQAKTKEIEAQIIAFEL